MYSSTCRFDCNACQFDVLQLVSGRTLQKLDESVVRRENNTNHKNMSLVLSETVEVLQEKKCCSKFDPPPKKKTSTRYKNVQEKNKHEPPRNA